ncbi:Troponin C, isoform 1 [Papilio machaon]|uniref:Troponin C, isoform 1 n=2 Tax=Papilio machaon TaxID=76193 RepID=A0A194QLJ1_PAPMA|nr:Troponin C, isoform 1 [Papilio machaon]
MAFRGVITRPPSNNNRCKADSCRVVCYNAPYYNSYEEDIINTAIDTEPNCEIIFLTLKNPMFVNSTLPLNWLSSLRSKIGSLAIIGGNLKHIAPNAFINTFATNVRTLSLEDVTLTNWYPETFIGLSNIEELFIKNTKLLTIHSGALKTIDDTLTTLDIKATNVWDPINITGSANPDKLTTVDFSKNIFKHILNKNSFSRLQNCKILYLNSCKISVIANGTFDHLINIEILFLNNNFIHTVPDGLFSQILTLKHKPRINLQDNPWRCECTTNELRKLHVHDLLIVEPSCYYPKEVQGLTFSEFENYCLSNDSQTQVIIPDINDYKNFNRSYQTLNIENKLSCDYDSDVGYEITPLISTSNEYRCTGFRAQNYKLIPTVSNSLCDLFSTDNKWLKPVFYSRSEPHSVIEISSQGPSNHGLLWYRANCPREIYCVSSLPQVLRIFNVNKNNNYIFCRFYNRTVLTDECVVYDFSKSDQSYRRKPIFLLCMVTAIVCLSLGALVVYGLIRKNPGLLKGSKRVLFVKHKQVDALVLPPKVPLRSNQMKETHFSKRVLKKTFEAFDQEKKGCIGTVMVGTILGMLGHQVSDESLQEIITEVDVDGSGELEFEEFVTLASRFMVEEDAEAMQQELKEAFRLYDKEGNGYITTTVLREILRELDDKISAEELDMMIEEIDSDGSGTVDFDEFMEVMTGGDD